MIPQAYTARDISEAYKWLQTLPPSIREEMKTMEQMVLNYLRAKSMGTLNNFTVQTTPAKPEIQKTLQNLKAEMDQFDFTPAPQHNHVAAPVQQVLQPQMQVQMQPQPQPQPQVQQHYQPHPQPQIQPQAQQAAPVVNSPTPSPDAAMIQNILSAIKMDPRSRQIMAEIREGLNLSTDLEVVRMSLILAHKTIKNILA